MTIRIYENRIDFGNYSLVVDNIGVSVKSSVSNTMGTLTSGAIEALNYPFQGTVLLDLTLLTNFLLCLHCLMQLTLEI